MEEARRRLRVCLLCIVAAAVIVGCIYYFSETHKSSDVSEGTLVKLQTESGGMSEDTPVITQTESGDMNWQEVMK